MTGWLDNSARSIRIVSSPKWGLTLLGAVLVAVASGIGAFAYFTSTGSGNATATAGSLHPPTTISATAASPSVTVQWTASALSNGTTYAQSYTVERYNNATPTPADVGPACGGATINASSGTGGPPAQFQCTDSPGAAGTYQYKITATYNSWTAPSAFTNTATTAFGPATQLVFTTQPVGGVAEATNLGTEPVVSVEDAAGNVVTNDTGNVTLAINSGPGAGSLSCTNSGFPTVAAVAGVAAFTACQITGTAAAGTYTLTATRSGLTAGTSGNVVINVGSANKLVFTTQPVGGVVEATNFGTSPAISVEDSSGNVVTTDTGNVTLAINSGPGAGSLSCTNSGFPTVAAVSGVATFTACQITGTAAAGTYTLTATRSGLTAGTSGNVVINVGAANKLAFTTQPVGGVSEAMNFGTEPTVSVEDSSGNIVTSDTGNVTLAIHTGPGAGSLSCTNSGFPTIAAVSGVATFTACQITGTAAAGTYTLTATRSGLTAATSGNVVINVGSANKLVFTTQPAGGVAEATNLATEPVVSVEDSSGNVVTTDTGNVTLAINTGQGAGSLSCTNSGFPTVAAVAGVATFTACQITGTAAAGTYTLTATRSGLTAGTSGNVVINVGSANKLVFTTLPAGGVVEATNFGTSPAISVEDSSGNVVTTDTGNVTLAINSGPGAGSLSCTNSGFPTVAAVSGVATFTACQITGTAAAGTYTLTATRSGLTAGTSGNVVINVGAANKLAFTTQPSGGVVSTTWSQQPAVAIEDSHGNTVTTVAATSITLTLSTGSGPLTCTSNSVTSNSGVSTFAGCKINTAGTGDVLTASGTYTSATSNSLTIFAAPAVSVVATGFVASGATTTSSSFTPISGDTYLIFAAHTSSASDSATVTSGPWASATAITSQTLTDGISWQWAWIATANTSSSSTATVTFANATTKTGDNSGNNIIEVVLLTNANASAPVSGSTLTAGGTTSIDQLSANLPTVSAGGSDVVFPYVTGDTSPTDTGWATSGFSTVTSAVTSYAHSGNATVGFGTLVGFAASALSGSATYGASQNWPAASGTAYGTIALGIAPQSAAPAITGVSPAAGTTAGTNTVTVTGANLTGETAVDFGATPGTSVSVNGGGTSLTVTAPAHAAGQVDVTVVTPIGTSATSSADHYTYDATPTVTAVSPATGSTSGGSVVTVTGTGFLSATSVKFASTAGTTLSVSSDTSLTITSPAGSAGTVDITVTNPTGTSTTSSADQFTYLVASATSLSPTSGAIGTTGVTISAAGFIASQALSVTVGGVSATITAGGTTNTSGSSTVTFTIPNIPTGAAAVVVSDGTNSATSATNFTVTGPSLTVSTTSMTAGSTVTVSWSGVSGPLATDWIAWYSPISESNTLFGSNWVWDDSCTTTDGSTTLASGSCTITMNTTGPWQFRLLRDNASPYTTLAVSPTVSVNQAPAITSASATTFPTSASSSFTVTTTGYPTPSITNSAFSGCTPSTLPGTVTVTDNGNGTATLAGNPSTSTGTYTVCLHASNGVGSAATQSFTLTVSAFSISGIQFIRTSSAGTYTCTASLLTSVSCTAGGTGGNNLTGYIQFFSGSGSYSYPMTALSNTSGSAIAITNSSVTGGGTPNPASFSVPSGSANSNSLTLVHNGANNVWTFTVVVNSTTYTLTVSVS